MGLNFELKQEQKTSLELRQEMQCCLEQVLQQRHPEFPNAARGLEGMEIASRILREKNAAGVLIGGLSEHVWDQYVTANGLALHKDVDVLALTPLDLDEDFEGGIDWWLPPEQTETRGWTNASGITLGFDMRTDVELPPGLYIPDRPCVIDMRTAEFESCAQEDEELDKLTVDRYRRHISNRIGHIMTPLIRKPWGRQIISKRVLRVS